MSILTRRPTTSRAADTAAATGAPTDSGRTLLPALGGLGLLVSPLLMFGATLTSPPQDSGSTEDYIESLARDPFISAVSANLFHYYWIVFALGALAAITLVRGRRGRVLTSVGGVLSAFGAIQISGLLYNDWVLMKLGDGTVDMATAVRLADGFREFGSVSIWLMSAQVFAILSPLVLFAGLARAGVMTWWIVPLCLGGLVLPYAVPAPFGQVLGLVCAAPTIVAGLRLIGRHRAGVRRQESIAEAA